MARKDAIEVDDTVVELLPKTMFPVIIRVAVAWCHMSVAKCLCISFACCQKAKLC
jgi:hypothetical protein